MINSRNYQRPDELKRNILISPDKKILYFSIPKCACSTIKLFLRTLYGQNLEEARQNIHSIENTPLLNYSHLDGDQELTRLINDKSVFKFSAIRDPRSRVYSAYKNKFIDESKDMQKIFLRQLNGIDKKYLNGTETISFPYFLELISLQTPLEMNEHWRPMCSQLLGLSPNEVKLYSLAEISQALKDVVSFSGIVNKYCSPDLNFSPHATNATQTSFTMTKSMISQIAELYKEDLYLYLYRETFSLI